MGDRQTDNPLKIQEISAEEFRACVDQDDFLRRYGNPVVIHSGGQRDVVCMAREYYERLMQERDLFIEDENIKYWIYEFEATQEKKLELERSAAKCCMTPDEFFAAAIEDGLRKAETDSGGCNSQHQKHVLQAEPAGIHLVRFYPVFKGETEAKALKRKLAEESIEGAADKHD